MESTDDDDLVFIEVEHPERFITTNGLPADDYPFLMIEGEVREIVRGNDKGLWIRRLERPKSWAQTDGIE